MKEHLERVKKIRQGSYGRVAASVRTGAEILMLQENGVGIVFPQMKRWVTRKQASRAAIMWINQ